MPIKFKVHYPKDARTNILFLVFLFVFITFMIAYACLRKKYKENRKEKKGQRNVTLVEKVELDILLSILKLSFMVKILLQSFFHITTVLTHPLLLLDY